MQLAAGQCRALRPEQARSRAPVTSGVTAVGCNRSSRPEIHQHCGSAGPSRCKRAALVVAAAVFAPAAISHASGGHTALLHGLGNIGDVEPAHMPFLLRLAHTRAKQGADSSQALQVLPGGSGRMPNWFLQKKVMARKLARWCASCMHNASTPAHTRCPPCHHPAQPRSNLRPHETAYRRQPVG